MTQEIEQRLEWSLTFEDELGGAARVGLFRLMAWSLGVIEGQHGGRLETDYWAFHRAKGTIEGVLDTIRPPLPPEFQVELERAESMMADAIEGWKRTASPLAERFPYPAPFNALAPGGAWTTIPEPRFSRVLTDAELIETLEGLSEDDAALVRAHQESVRAARTAEAMNSAMMDELNRRADIAAFEARSKIRGIDQTFREKAAEIDAICDGVN